MTIGKVVHITSAHARNDIRIFVKECCSLARMGIDVSLVVADGLSKEVVSNVKIYGVPKAKSRRERMFITTNRIYSKALELDGDIYHLHDPELLPVALRLKRQGKKVVFDAHEDVPKQIMGKPYLNKLAKWILSKSFAVFERWVCPKLDAVVTATPAIQEKFKAMGLRSENINNYPILGELEAGDADWSLKGAEVAYVGGISRIRGILEVVKAMGLTTTEVSLQLAGEFNEVEVEKEALSLNGWQRVCALGVIGREEVKGVLSRSVAGVVTFLPLPNHVDAQPNKMFEYMSAGIPVIGSNFPLWKEIIDGNNCGICVDPLNPQQIADAIDYLVDNPSEAKQMGLNGLKAVRERYNWAIEEQKLLNFYQSV